MLGLKKDLDDLAWHFHGRLGYYVKNLRTGESIGFRQDERFPSASTIKTVIMIETVKQIEEGKFAWTDKVKLPPRASRSQSMWAAFLPEDISLNVDGLTNLMMNVSDNTAAISLADKVGVENIEKRLLGWGYQNTVCTIHAPSTNQRLSRLHKSFNNMGVTSPHDMGEILEGLYRRRLASPAASERMLRIMNHQYWDDFFMSQIPPGVYACSKVGALERSRSDSAIVFGPTPYVITAYTDDGKDKSWGDDNEGHVVLRTISHLVWNALNPGMKYDAPKDAQKWFPTGSGVE